MSCKRIIDVRTVPWGIHVISVEVKDVLIPLALQDAMSMQAQAERERQARIILGDSERQVAEKFGEAAKTYADNPTAFHLRAMNMLYEGLKRSNSTIVIVPSSAIETMQLGGLAGNDRSYLGPGPPGRVRGRGHSAAGRTPAETAFQVKRRRQSARAIAMGQRGGGQTTWQKWLGRLAPAEP